MYQPKRLTKRSKTVESVWLKSQIQKWAKKNSQRLNLPAKPIAMRVLK